MLICAAGDSHGAMDRLYQNVSAFEVLLGVRFLNVYLPLADRWAIYENSGAAPKLVEHGP
jgi:hypothetical protein